MEHNDGIIGWVLSLLPGFKEDVAERLDGNTRMTIERVIPKLHIPPNPNPKTSEEPLDIILDFFWKEFDYFQNKTDPYGYCPGRF